MSNNTVPIEFKHLVEPLVIEKGEEAILVVHGFTGSPSELYPFCNFMADNNYSINCILLPGHGTSHLELEECNWEEWYQAVEDEYEAMLKKYKKVYLAGLSMGGVLCLNLASKRKVDGIIALASGVRLKDWRVPLIPIIKLFTKRIPKTNNSYARGPDRNRFAYEYNSATPTIELVKLNKSVENDLGKITSPLLLIHSKNDIVIPYSNVVLISSKVKSENIKIVTLNKAGHIITLSDEKDVVYKESLAFLKSL